MRASAIGMSVTEIKLAALSEGTEMGLFMIGNETHLLEVVRHYRLDEIRCAK